MTEEGRHRAFLGGWFAAALRAGLSADSVTAVFGALRPLVSGPEVLRAPGRREAVLAALRGH